MTKPITQYTAQELIQAIQQQHSSIVEITTAFLDHIDKYNPQINAIVWMRDRNDILKEAEEKDKLLQSGKANGELFGLPIFIPL